MIDKPRDKIIYKWLHHCYHWTVLDIFTNCRSTRCEKKNVRKIRKFFLSLCFLSDAKNELSSQQQSALLHVQKNMYQISRKITKRSKNDSTIQWIDFWNVKKRNIHLYTSPLLLFSISHEHEREETKGSRIKSGPRNEGTATIRWQRVTRGIKRGPPRRALMNFTRYCARIVSPGQEFTPIRPDHRGNFEPDRKLLRFPPVSPPPSRNMENAITIFPFATRKDGWKIVFDQPD